MNKRLANAIKQRDTAAIALDNAWTDVWCVPNHGRTAARERVERWVESRDYWQREIERCKEATSDD